MADNDKPKATNRDLATLPLRDALEEYTPEIEVALPAHMSVDRYKRVVITAVNQSTPQNNLATADRRSLLNACVKCAQDGLYPDGREAVLVVYNTKMKDERGQEYWLPLVQYQPMIQGIYKRMRNSGEVLSATAEVVYEHDSFDYHLGDDPRIEHRPPPFGSERGKPLGAYAIIKLRNGEVLRETMDYADIERTRKQSRSPDSLMWKHFWGEGARKTVMRRCSKRAPTGSELERLLARDDELPQLPPITEMRRVEPRPEFTDAPEITRDGSGRLDNDEPGDDSSETSGKLTGEPPAGDEQKAQAAAPASPAAPAAAAKATTTPRTRAAKAAAAAPPSTPPSDGQFYERIKYFFHDSVGEVSEYDDADEAVTAYAARLEAAKDPKALEATWENGAQLISTLREHGHNDMADALNTEYGQLAAELEVAETKQVEAPPDYDVVVPLAPPDDIYDVVVPLAASGKINQWYMDARERLKAMDKADRPPGDYRRFREANKVLKMRLRNEMRTWEMMLEKEIVRGETKGWA